MGSLEIYACVNLSIDVYEVYVELPRAKFQREFAQRRDFCVQNSLALATFWNRNFSIFWRDAERFLKQLGLKQQFVLEFESEIPF